MVKFCTNRANRVDYVVVYRLDRLARNNHDYAVYTAALAVRDVAIRSATEPITDDATGKFIQTVLSGIAELDNDVRGQRAKDGMLRVVEKGGWPHKAPLGYVNGRDSDDWPILMEHPKQGPMIRQAFTLAATGKHTLTQIRGLMERKGWESAFGSKPLLQVLERTLRKPINGGIITGRLTGGKPIDARFKGLVDKGTFYKVQRVLDGKGHVIESRKNVNPEFPLRRFVSCARCGKPLTGSFTQGHGGRYAYYRCANPACPKVNVPKDKLEGDFRAMLDVVTATAMPQFEAFRDRVRQVWEGRHADAIEERKRPRSRALQTRHTSGQAAAAAGGAGEAAGRAARQAGRRGGHRRGLWQEGLGARRGDRAMQGGAARRRTGGGRRGGGFAGGGVHVPPHEGDME
jgi:hypothetical protein